MFERNCCKEPKRLMEVFGEVAGVWNGVAGVLGFWGGMCRTVGWFGCVGDATGDEGFLAGAWVLVEMGMDRCLEGRYRAL